MKHHSSLGAAFRYAGTGVWRTVRTQRNIRIHLTVALLVIAGAWFFAIRPWQWAIIVVAIGMVIALELVNTAVEAVVDLVSPEYHPLAKISKDAAAGAVLVMALATVALGFVIYLPRLGNFGAQFMVRWRHSPFLLWSVMVALVAMLILIWGIIPLRQNDEGGQAGFR